MITVKQFLDAGFELALGDVLVAPRITAPLNSADMLAIDVDVSEYIDYKIKSLSWRKNKGEQPVADGLSVIFHDEGASDYYALSEDVHWQGNKHCFWKPNLAALEYQMNDKQDMMTQAESDDIEHLEKSALEMSERDIPSFDEPIIVNPFDACASNEDGDYVEWKNGDECHYHSTPNVLSKFVAMHPNNPKAAIIWEGGGDCNLACVAIECLRKPESPQEKAKREREENGKALFELKVSLTSISCVHWDDQAESSKESWRQFAELVTLKDEHKE